MSTRDLPLSRLPENEHGASTVIVEDLLNGLSEWRSVQDIVRLSIRALADTVRSQGNALKDLQYMQSDFASKSEVSSSLALKANLSDLSRTVSETRASLDSKASYEEVRAFVEDRVTRTDLLQLLQGKVSVEEFRAAIEFKVDVKEMQNELRTLRNCMEELKQQTVNTVKQCASQRDMQTFSRILEGKADLAEMNAVLNEKATKTSVANALHKKANKADVEEMLMEKASAEVVTGLTAAIEGKVGIASFNMLAAEVDKKVDSSLFEKTIKQETSKKADLDDLENLFATVNSIKKEIEIKLQQQSILLGNHISDLRSEQEMTKLSLTNALEKKAEFRDLEKMSELVLKKPDSDEMNYMLTNLKNDYVALMQNQQSAVRQELKRLESAFNEQIQYLDNKYKVFENEQSSVREFVKSSNEKQRHEFEDLAKFMEKSKNEETRAIRYDIEKIQREFEDAKKSKSSESEQKSKTWEIKALQEEVDYKIEQLDSRLKDFAKSTKDAMAKNEEEIAAFTGSIKTSNQGLEFYQNALEEVKSSTLKRQDWEDTAYKLEEELEKLGKEVLLKANIKDICTLLDIKANIDDVNHALEELHQELDGKVSIEELAEKLKEQNVINEALCAENCVARWLWKSGDSKNGNVPWEIQTINTCPENFIWEKDKTTVLALSAGLYQVSFGVFSRKKSSIQLLVNGEVVITEGNLNGKAIGKHSSGNLAGNTCHEYLSLPARARIALAFSGEPCEGFLGIKKL